MGSGRGDGTCRRGDVWSISGRVYEIEKVLVILPASVCGTAFVAGQSPSTGDYDLVFYRTDEYKGAYGASREHALVGKMTGTF